MTTWNAVFRIIAVVLFFVNLIQNDLQGIVVMGFVLTWFQLNDLKSDCKEIHADLQG